MPRFEAKTQPLTLFSTHVMFSLETTFKGKTWYLPCGGHTTCRGQGCYQDDDRPAPSPDQSPGAVQEEIPGASNSLLA